VGDRLAGLSALGLVRGLTVNQSKRVRLGFDWPLGSCDGGRAESGLDGPRVRDAVHGVWQEVFVARVDDRRKY
jgi:hypothetical protein